MRRLYCLLALANVRWAMADMERSNRLQRLSDEALTRSEERMQMAAALADRSTSRRR